MNLIFEIDRLRAYQQADADGVMVLVSRQTCEEAYDEIERLHGLLAECRDAFPVPPCGSDLEGAWLASIAAPAEVPHYLRAIAAKATAAPEMLSDPEMVACMRPVWRLEPERWYVLDRDGLATLCKDEDDAQDVAASAWVRCPQRGPYRIALLGDVSAERERNLALMHEIEALTRGRDLAAHRMQESTAYAIELREKLNRYETSAPMHMNAALLPDNAKLPGPAGVRAE